MFGNNILQQRMIKSLLPSLLPMLDGLQEPISNFINTKKQQIELLEFEKEVIDDFANKSIEGLTPNPCIVCNKKVKWASLLKYANGIGADFIATGHYCKVLYNDNRYYISRPKDLTKDQSYFLWTLTQKQLVHCLFPIGDYLKPEVRAVAARAGLPTAAKKDSQGICFLGDINLADFLKRGVHKFLDLDIGAWNLFGTWCLESGISIVNDL